MDSAASEHLYFDLPRTILRKMHLITMVSSNNWMEVINNGIKTGFVFMIYLISDKDL